MLPAEPDGTGIVKLISMPTGVSSNHVIGAETRRMRLCGGEGLYISLNLCSQSSCKDAARS